MVCVSLAAGMLALLGGGRQDRSIASDPQLKTPITIASANRPISEVLKDIATKTKTPLIALKLIADAKVTVYVDDEPAWVVLDKLADVLMAEWNPTDAGGFRLSVPNETTSFKRTYIEREDKLLREPVELQIAEIAKAADTPFPVLDARRRTLETELSTTKSSARKAEIKTLLETINEKLDPTRYALGTLFRSMPTASLASFWQGKTVFAQLPAAGGRQNRRGGRNGRGGRGNNQNNQNVDDSAGDQPQQPVGPSVYVFAKFDPIRHALKLSGKASLAPAKAKPQLDAEALKNQTFGKMISSWPSIQVEDSDKRTKEPARVALDDRIQGTLADALSQFHEQTHLPVVADGSRMLARFSAEGSDLASFARDLGRKTGGYVKVSGRYLEVRHPDFWRLLDREAPESKFDVIEAKAAKLNLTIDDYATFLTGLTQLQIQFVCSDIPQQFKFESEPLRTAWPALRLYASLQGITRETAFQDLGCGYRTLDANQKALFVDAITEGVFIGIPEGMASNVIMSANDPQVLPSYNLRVTPFAGTDAATGAEKIGIRLGYDNAAILYSFVSTTGR